MAVQRTSLSTAHAQPAARLLVELRALERQRCRNALLGCCLRRARLGARLVHLGRSAQSAGHGTRWVNKLAFTMAELFSLCLMLPHAHGECNRLLIIVRHSHTP